MAKTEANNQKFIKRHKFKLQTGAFVAIIILPFLLYVAAQAGQEIIVNILIGLMALVMLAIVLIS